MSGEATSTDDPADLAGEYVLGTLAGPERRDVERRLATDAVLRAAVADWEVRLLPLTALAPLQEPTASLWLGIERGIAPAPAVSPASASASVACEHSMGRCAIDYMVRDAFGEDGNRDCRNGRNRDDPTIQTSQGCQSFPHTSASDEQTDAATVQCAECTPQSSTPDLVKAGWHCGATRAGQSG